MLKWFAVASTPGGAGGGGGAASGRGRRGDSTGAARRGGGGVAEAVTDDPLATLTLTLPRIPGGRGFYSAAASRKKGGKHHQQQVRTREIYAVSRVNPIFEDDDSQSGSIFESPSPSSSDHHHHVGDAPPSPVRKSGSSSGYDSNPTDRTSSSEFSDDGPPGQAYSPSSTRTTRGPFSLATAAAVAGQPRTPVRRSNSRHRKRVALEIPVVTSPLMAISHPALSTIPEDKIPPPQESVNSNSIPPPVWPSAAAASATTTTTESSSCNAASHSTSIVAVAVDDLAARPPAATQQPPPPPPLCGRCVVNPLPISASSTAVHSTTTTAPVVGEQQVSSINKDIILQQPSCRRYQRLRGIDAIKELWDKSGMKVNGCRRLLVESDEEQDSLERGGCQRLHLSGDVILEMPPAQTLDPPPPPPPLPPLTTSPPPIRDEDARVDGEGGGGGDASSTASSSGYSEISLVTPPRRSVSPPSPDLMACSLPPVFHHRDLEAVSNSVRNAMIYGTLCRIKCASGLSVSSYEKLLKTFDPILRDLDPSINNKKASKNVIDSPKTSWDLFPEIHSTISKTSFDKTAHLCPPTPDFTLDIPRSERLLRKIEAANRQRFWGRLVLCFLGLFFFLFSVMAVSMVYTRGRRLFGSL